MKLDIFKLARDNRPRHKAHFEELVKDSNSSEAGVLSTFASLVNEEARVAINMPPYVVADFLARGVHFNIYDWAEEQASLLGRSSEEWLREKLGPYFEPRMAFDSRIVGGTELRYGCLIVGGTGPIRYGPFCVTLVRDFHSSVALFPGDSLARYVDAENSIRKDLLVREVAAIDSRHQFVTLVRAARIYQAPRDAWAQIVCSGDEYIEAVFNCRVHPKQVEAIRITQQDYQAFRELAFQDFGRNLSPGEKAIVNDFVSILRSTRDGEPPLEVVDYGAA